MKPIRYRGIKDQNDQFWVEITQGRNRHLAKVTAIMNASNQFFTDLAQRRIVAVTDSTKRDIKEAIQNLAYSKRLDIADRMGWHRNCVVLGDDELIAANNNSTTPRLALGASSKSRSRASLRDWKREVAQVAAGRSRLVFALSLGFAPPLLKITGEQNFGVEFVGPSSIGKWSLIACAASVWGRSSVGKEGFIETWKTTDEGVEKMMLAHHDSLLVMDETNLAGAGWRQADRLHDAIFRLSAGAEKVRYNAPGEIRASRLIYVTTANQSAEEIARRASMDASPIRVRLLSVPAQASESFGVLERVPKRFASSSEAVNHLTSATQRYYGTAIRHFLRKLVAERAAGRKALAERLRQRIDQFVASAGVGPNEGQRHRTARAFGLICAAGELACEYGALPETWTGVERAVMKCWRAHDKQFDSGVSGQLAIARVWAYAHKHRRELIDISNRKPNLSDEQLKLVPGFLKGRGRDTELLVPTARFRSAFGNASALMEQLRGEGLARTERGAQKKLSTKAVVRKGGKKIRVYCIRIGEFGERP